MPNFTDYYGRRTGTVPDNSPRTSCVTIHNRGPSSMGRARRSPKTPFSFALEARNRGCRRTVFHLNSRGTDRREESMATTGTRQQPTPERFFNSINAYEQTEAMKAALELEIFTAIAEGNTTAATIAKRCGAAERGARTRSEEHTSELQSHSDLVCRLLLEKKKKPGTQSDVVRNSVEKIDLTYQAVVGSILVGGDNRGVSHALLAEASLVLTTSSMIQKSTR